MLSVHETHKNAIFRDTCIWTQHDRNSLKLSDKDKRQGQGTWTGDRDRDRDREQGQERGQMAYWIFTNVKWKKKTKKQMAKHSVSTTHTIDCP